MDEQRGDVCCLGGWDRGHLFFLVMVERTSPQTTRRRPGPTTKAEPAPFTGVATPNELTCALVSRWLIIVAAPVRLDPLSPAIAVSSLAVSLVRGNPLAQFRPAGRLAWERGAQPLSGLSGPRGIRGRTPAASAARSLYSGAGDAGGDLPRRNPGPGGRMGGLGERAVLVAGTEAVLRPAQPWKLEI